MRRSDLSAARQRQLVKCDQPHANCSALVPTVTPRRLPSDVTVVQALARAEQALERLRTATALLPNMDLVTRTLARREAVQSSQIEGTRTQLPELLEYEATQGQDGAPTADAAITERYVEALDLGLATLRGDKPNTGLDLILVTSMHAVLMRDADPERYRPGKYRETQAWIGGGHRIEDATFVPPPPRFIASCMDELEESMLKYRQRDDEQGSLSLIAQVAIAHAQFETIHPFVDGNGRIGRLLIPLMLADAGYPPLYLSGYLSRYRSAYYDALAQVQLRDRWAPWAQLLARAVVQACDESIAIAQDLNAMADRWRAMLSDLRADAAARRLPELLLGQPVVSIRQVEAALGVSFVTANKAVEQLVARGILTEPARRRNRVFHASELLERLAMH